MTAAPIVLHQQPPPSQSSRNWMASFLFITHRHPIMNPRKRQSDTTIVTTGDRDMVSDAKPTPKSRLKIRVKRFHGVARWTWNAGSDDEVCGICQSAFEGVAPGCKYPGDECPVVFGKCGHAFHLQCVATWLNSSRQTCPICRAEWEYGASTDQQRRSDSN